LSALQQTFKLITFTNFKLEKMKRKERWLKVFKPEIETRQTETAAMTAELKRLAAELEQMKQILREKVELCEHGKKVD
jgi:hypothetical protein